jgi:hypothetical protein
MNDKQEWEDGYSAQEHDEAQDTTGKLIDGAVEASLSDWEEPQLPSTQEESADVEGEGQLSNSLTSKPWVAEKIDAKVKEKTYREKLLNSARNGSAALCLLAIAVVVYGIMQAAHAQEMINNHQDSGPAFAYANTAAMVLLFVVAPILFLSLTTLDWREFNQGQMYDEVSHDLRKLKKP